MHIVCGNSWCHQRISLEVFVVNSDNDSGQVVGHTCLLLFPSVKQNVCVGVYGVHGCMHV